MIKVYAARGTRSQRVIWVLEELGAPYETVSLTFPPRMHHPEFFAISPAGALPAIEDDGVVLIESLAICEYLSRKFAGRLVVGAEEPGFTDYLQFLHFGEGTLAPPLAWARRFGPRLESVMADAREAFALRLAVVEHALADGRAYLAADRLTLADISVGYTLGLSDLAGLHQLLPASVLAYEARLEARPAYQRAYQPA
ncbi:glutathione S-transferase family protein [Phenylobacterium sp.]|uniref:glutathione S-transferase family protein n=1 Tax=Phenylobacterium sp. TaxID=1871053 RepID=UPI00286B2F53|nr:glutathione S-transferase family protein [Phenylobacterium sp.]